MLGYDRIQTVQYLWDSGRIENICFENWLEKWHENTEWTGKSRTGAGKCELAWLAPPPWFSSEHVKCLQLLRSFGHLTQAKFLVWIWCSLMNHQILIKSLILTSLESWLFLPSSTSSVHHNLIFINSMKMICYTLDGLGAQEQQVHQDSFMS